MGARLGIVFGLLGKGRWAHAAPHHVADAAAAQNDQEHGYTAHQQPDLGLRARGRAATAWPIIVLPVGIDAISRTNPSATNGAPHLAPRPLAGTERNSMITLRTIDIILHDNHGIGVSSEW